jgi:hypothetical protein
MSDLQIKGWPVRFGDGRNSIEVWAQFKRLSNLPKPLYKIDCCQATIVISSAKTILIFAVPAVLVAAIHRKDPGSILGQSTVYHIYIRILYLLIRDAQTGFFRMSETLPLQDEKIASLHQP